MADFLSVERNLRDMFRLLGSDRPRGDVRELTGVTVASAGSEFQMFNAAFFNLPVADQVDLDRRITLAQSAFTARGLPWSLWVCEELIAEPLRHRLVRSCQRIGLHLGSEMPAMAAEAIQGKATVLEDELKILPVQTSALLNEFCRIGASCFRVPLPWFQEIFNNSARLGEAMLGWVGFCGSNAVSTIATVQSEDVIGIYNLATVQRFRARGFGEAMLRHAVTETYARSGVKPVVLQSTRPALRLYERLGFQAVGRILVFPSR